MRGEAGTVSELTCPQDGPHGDEAQTATTKSYAQQYAEVRTLVGSCFDLGQRIGCLDAVERFRLVHPWGNRAGQFPTARLSHLCLPATT